jgi:hypothetical protein
LTYSEVYPSGAYILTLVGGIFVLLGGLGLSTVGAVLTFFAFGLGGIIGILGIIWGILLIYAATRLKSNPGQHGTWGALIVLFSLLSWFGGLGGFLIGFLLSLIGGILAIVWNPTSISPPTTYQPTPQNSGRFCSNCGSMVSQETKFCPRCGKQLTS